MENQRSVHTQNRLKPSVWSKIHSRINGVVCSVGGPLTSSRSKGFLFIGLFDNELSIFTILIQFARFSELDLKCI